MSSIHVGTSAITAAGWQVPFYPEGMKPADFLTYYATKFETVELGSAFYRTPSVVTVNGWERKTPKGFILQGAADDYPRKGVAGLRRRSGIFS
jgi:uncharacterized protein YecE (DUF72 family)